MKQRLRIGSAVGLLAASLLCVSGGFAGGGSTLVRSRAIARTSNPVARTSVTPLAAKAPLAAHAKRTATGRARVALPTRSRARTREVGRATSHASAPGVAGLVVGIDPETGQLGMPTPEQMAELSAIERNAVNHSSEGLVQVYHPDGSVSMDLQGRFQEFSMVRTGPDGKLIPECVDHAAAVKRALKDHRPAPRAPEER